MPQREAAPPLPRVQLADGRRGVLLDTRPQAGKVRVLIDGETKPHVVPQRRVKPLPSTDTAPLPRIRLANGREGVLLKAGRGQAKVWLTGDRAPRLVKLRRLTILPPEPVDATPLRGKISARVPDADATVIRMRQAEADGQRAAFDEEISDDFDIPESLLKRFRHRQAQETIAAKYARLHDTPSLHADSVEEAYAQAKRLGVDYVINAPKWAPEDLLLALNRINAALLEAVQGKRPIPNRIEIDEVAWWKWANGDEEKLSRPARMASAKGILRINPRHPYWTVDDCGRQELIEFMIESGASSTDYYDHVMRHELSHLEHYLFAGKDAFLRARAVRRLSSEEKTSGKQLANRFSIEEETAILEHVSEYALRNGVEFVAEVRCGLLAHQQYPDILMKLYRNLRGPEDVNSSNWFVD